MRVCSVGPVVAAGEVADGLGEQPAEELDLLPLPGAAGTEVPPEGPGLVLDVVPVDPDIQPNAVAGKEIDIGRLHRHRRCLALREGQEPGGEAEALGDAGRIGEHHHKRVAERVVLGA